MSSSSLRPPVGLVLAGGAALAGWQIGALSALEKSLGPVFDAALGFSAGALNAAAYACGRTEEALEAWLRVDLRVLRPVPRLAPFSLFSNRPLFEAMSFLPDDEQAKAQLRRRLVVSSVAFDRKSRIHAVYEPGGRWDAPLKQHLAASCAIPWIFPPVSVPVDGHRVLAVDGGVWCVQPMLFGELGSCRDIVILEMVRSDEPHKEPRGPLERLYWHSREVCRRAVDDAVAAHDGQGPRVFRLQPSRRLDFEMLHFFRSRIRDATDLGRSDAKAFIASPERFQATAASKK